MAKACLPEGFRFHDLWGQRLEWFPLHRAEAVFILPLSVATFLVGSQLMRAGLFEHAGGRCATAGALAWGRDECRSVPSRARSHQARRQTMPPERSDTTRRETAG